MCQHKSKPIRPERYKVLKFDRVTSILRISAFNIIQLYHQLTYTHYQLRGNEKNSRCMQKLLSNA